MDPLSISVSILAILGGTRKVGKGLRKLTSRRYAPDILLALNNEVSDLRTVIFEVEDLAKQHREAIGRHLGVCNAIARIKETLLGLEELITYDLTKIGDLEKPDKTTILLGESKIARMNSQIKASKENLNAALTRFNS